MENLHHWIRDYFYAFHRQGFSFLYTKPPSHYLGYILENKNPIILIPGLFEKWYFMKEIADPLSLLGHPIYVLENLGYNTDEIHKAANLVNELINDKKLENIIIIAHSKGGIIAKDILVSFNKDKKVKKVITIATPFGGSGIIKYLPHKNLKELSPQSEIIKKLSKEKEVNKKIISIFGTFDNHVWPETSSYLEGAKNIQIKEYGHHKILSNKEVLEIILFEIENNY